MILSIVIPVYNVEKFVEKCIRSCANQNISSFEYEIIVVNDGSKDNSLEVVERVSSEFSNIKIVSQENKGLSAARNKGIELSRGEYLMFVDSDDWIKESCLSKIVNILKNEQPDCLAICSAIMCGEEAIREFSYTEGDVKSGIQFLISGAPQCAPYSIWRKSFLLTNNLRFYEGIFHEDAEFTPRAYYYAKKISFTNDIIYFVYQNINSITRTVNPKKSFDIISFVCKNLSDFAQNIEEEYRYIYSNIISMMYNNSISYILTLEKGLQHEFENHIFINRKFLYKHLSFSTIYKYKVEGFLLRLFPRKPLMIYRCLKKISSFSTKLVTIIMN